MPNYAIMRLEKRKLGSVTRICNHHERLKEQYKSNPDIDISRTDLNYHLVLPEKKYRELVLNRIEEVGAKRRKDSVVMQDGLITASPDWIKEKSTEEQMEFFNYAYEFVKDSFREENIISAVVHLDEATPHMHFVFVPLTEDNRLSSKDIIGGPKGLREWQDKFYMFIQEKYPDLKRGIPKSVTHRKHIPTYMFKNADEMFNHYEEICKAINDIGMIGNAQKKDEAVALIGKYAPEMAAMNSQLKMTDKYVLTLEKSIQDLKKNSSNKSDLIYDQREEIEALKDKVSELNYKQHMLMKKIEKIPPEVLEQLKNDEKKRRRVEREKR